MDIEITATERAEAVLESELKKQPHNRKDAFECALERLIADGDSDACYMLAHIVRNEFGAFAEDDFIRE